MSHIPAKARPIGVFDLPGAIRRGLVDDHATPSSAFLRVVGTVSFLSRDPDVLLRL
jgi:hypothetical protein